MNQYLEWENRKAEREKKKAQKDNNPKLNEDIRIFPFDFSFFLLFEKKIFLSFFIFIFPTLKHDESKNNIFIFSTTFRANVPKMKSQQT